MTSATGARKTIDCPRSPRAARARKRAYCAGRGRSRPRSWRSAATSAGAADSPSMISTGSPGTRWRKAKTRVAPPVDARGRLQGRVEGEVVEVRIPDADPGQSADLEISAADVRIEGAPLVRAHVQRDADGGELRLDRLREAASAWLGRGLVDQPETGQRPRAIRVSIAGPVEQPAGPLRVVTRDAGGRVGPVLGCQEAGGGSSRAAEDEAQEGLTIERCGDRLADAPVGQPGVAVGEGQGVEARTGRPPHRQVRSRAAPVEHLGPSAV